MAELPRSLELPEDEIMAAANESYCLLDLLLQVHRADEIEEPNISPRYYVKNLKYIVIPGQITNQSALDEIRVGVDTKEKVWRMGNQIHYANLRTMSALGSEEPPISQTGIAYIFDPGLIVKGEVPIEFSDLEIGESSFVLSEQGSKVESVPGIHTAITGLRFLPNNIRAELKILLGKGSIHDEKLAKTIEDILITGYRKSGFMLSLMHPEIVELTNGIARRVN